MPSPALSRRRVLLSAALVCGFAGCSGAPGGQTDPDSAEQETDDVDDGGITPETTGAEGSGGSTGETPTPVTPADASTTTVPSPGTASSSEAETRSTTASSEALDLREANVVGVEFDRSGEAYRFSVTLYHDDDGESGYADWWQVETLEGEQLGRRTLLHAHSTAPFTRSERITIPAGTKYVVVRGHDQTHGYGGQAMVVTLETGETEAIRQGPEPQDFSGYEPGR